MENTTSGQKHPQDQDHDHDNLQDTFPAALIIGVLILLMWIGVFGLYLGRM